MNLNASEEIVRTLAELLNDWLDEYYFENYEGKYRECKVCGSDDTEDHTDDCLVPKTMNALRDAFQFGWLSKRGSNESWLSSQTGLSLGSSDSF